MMYKVMIVDDETIILSGIKSLLDWEKMTASLLQQPETDKMLWNRYGECRLILCW